MQTLRKLPMHAPKRATNGVAARARTVSSEEYIVASLVEREVQPAARPGGCRNLPLLQHGDGKLP